MFTAAFSRRTFLLLLACLFVRPLCAAEFWTGTGGDSNWSTPGNWLDGSIPANPELSTVTFAQEGADTTNIVDRNWGVRYLVYTNHVSRHTTDLGGNKLTVLNDFAAGQNSTSSWVTLQNGVIQLGTGIYSGSLYAGYKTIAAARITNAELIVNAHIAVSNGNLIYVGYNKLNDGDVSGTMDLSCSTVSTRGVADSLIMSSIVVSWHGASASTLKLPASLKVLETTGALMVGGYGQTPLAGIGILDFGANSSLTNFRVRGDFMMGDQSASGVVTNLPDQVHLEVGLPNTPRKMYISNHSIRNATGTEAKLRMGGGRFTGYLTDLGVGIAHGEGEGTSTGVLDLAATQLQIGPEPDRIAGVNALAVCSGKAAFGLLRIPSSVTDISVGSFTLGRGSYSGANGLEASGILDIGSNSMLRCITATNGFYWAVDNGKALIGYTNETGAFVESFPTGLTLSIGTPEKATPFHLAGSRAGLWYPRNTGSIILSNGILRAYVSDLFVGFITEAASAHPNYGFSTGLLDLTDALVSFNGATNSVTVDRMIIGGPTLPNQAGPKGLVKLPSSITNFTARRLVIGSGGSYAGVGGEGRLDFGTNSQLRTLTIGGDLWLGAQNGATGELVNLPTQNLAFVIGSPGSPGSLLLGTHDTYDQARKGYGDLTLTGATFQAWLTNLWVGASFCAAVQGGVSGRLDLSQSTLSNLNVDGSILVGMGSNSYAGSKSLGRLVLPEGVARAGVFQVGNLNTTNTYGLVELFGTRLIITNRCIILPSGIVTNHINGTSAGLDILNDNAGALAITGRGRIHLSFDAEPANPFEATFGLRWAGDKAATLQALSAANSITWKTNTISAAALKRFGIHYDYSRETTFIGFRRLQTWGSLITIQ